MWLRYLTAYALWFIAMGLGYLVVDVSRQAAFAVSIHLSGGNPNVVRLADRVFFVVTGLGWLAFAVLMESYFRNGVRQRDLVARLSRLLVVVSAVLFISQGALMLAMPGTITGTNVAILIGSLVVGVGLGLIVLLRRSRHPPAVLTNRLCVKRVRRKRFDPILPFGMNIGHLTYPLCDGYIHNWLVAGPQAIYVPDLDRFSGPDFKLRIAQRYYDEASGIPMGTFRSETPAECAKLTVGEFTGEWVYYRCRDDHFVDVTAFHHTCHYLRAWAYAELVSPAALETQFTLTTNGPADVWINGQHVHRHEHFHHQQPHSVPFCAALREGHNGILVRFEEVATRECPYAMALRVAGAFDPPLGVGGGGAVRLPTAVAPVDRRALLENVFHQAVLDRDVFTRDQPIMLCWPMDATGEATLAVRLQRPDGRIYAEALRKAAGGARIEMGMPVQFPEGEYRLVIMPHPQEYYEGGMRVQRAIPISLSHNRYSTAPYGTYQERRTEALHDAAVRDDTIFNDVARVALGRWRDVDEGRVLRQIASINQRADCSDFYLCGLLGALYRFGENPSLPQPLRQPFEDCILNFKYWHDEPGSDAMWYTSENHSILFHTCEVLAGQRYPDRIFSNVGRTGAWHRAKGERLAMTWLQQRARGGFLEWDSNCYFEEDVLALSHLADLAEDDALAEMAAVVLDKLCFTMAVNSYKGVFGSTHGRTYTPHIKGAYREATSAIGRLLWGMGVFNRSAMGTVSLACSHYELPPIIAAVAADLPDEMWNRERHAGRLEGYAHVPATEVVANKAAYRTPDFMLCSAQDYHPGEHGYQQHIWQATLGPDAVVFVTHPPCASEEGSHRPNFWHGNAVLPRVAQYHDALIALYRLPDDDWMGFTHAYFPLYAFDEVEVGERWAFGRKGEGYVALAACGGLTPVDRGENARRELRSSGLRNAWLCQMGRAAVDGRFDAFKATVLAMPLAFDAAGPVVEWRTARGDALRFGWEGPLLRNGAVEPISGFKHYDNPYCSVNLLAEAMDIRLGEDMLRLVFAPDREPAPWQSSAPATASNRGLKNS
jgi:hypothetical protein